MEPAQQDSAVDVGVALLRAPVVAVVRFAVRGWAVAAGPHASAVTGGEGEPLLRREQSLLAPDIERVPGAVDAHEHPGGLAQRLVEHRTRQRRTPVLDVRDAQETPERVTRADGIPHRYQPHTGLTRPEHVLGRGQSPRSNDVHHEVVGQLLVRATIAHE